MLQAQAARYSGCLRIDGQADTVGFIDEYIVLLGKPVATLCQWIAAGRYSRTDGDTGKG